MMNSLYISQTGLQGSRYSIDNTSNNIANENTAGYNKRVSSTSELSPTSNNKIGSGLSFDSVDRVNNFYLYNKMVAQTSTTSYYSQKNAILEGTEQAFQETDTYGFSLTLNNYFYATETLRSDPNDLIYQNDFAVQSQQLVTQIQDTYSDLEELQEQTSNLLEEEVAHVNNILDEIAKLNKQIFESSDTPNDLYDKRDLLERELATYVDIKVEDSYGNYSLEIAGEIAIFNNTNVHPIDIEVEELAQKDIYDTTALNDSSLTNGDTITLTLNSTTSIDIIVDTTGASDNDVKQQIVDAINNDPQISKEIEARIDTNGNLIIESKTKGENSKFDLEIELDEANTIFKKSDIKSIPPETNTSISIYNEELNLQGGSLKALSQELTTSTSSISSYKQSLDDFVKTFVDMNSSYIMIGDEFLYGDTNAKEYTGTETINETNLFSGSSVDTFAFDEEAVQDLSTKDLEYLTSIQWKEDISFSNGETSSFSEYYQNLRYEVSSNKENTDSLFKSQEAISMNLQNSYDQLTKVDNDEELINLMKFQAAYEANAKVVTSVDEMLQTILNM